MGKRGQVFTLEFVMGMAIFIVALLGFFITIDQISSRKSIEINNILETSNIIYTFFEKSQNSFISNYRVDNQKLDAISEINYLEIKDELNIKGDFCIYFQDKNGFLIRLNNNKVGLGSENILINDVPCGRVGNEIENIQPSCPSYDNLIQKSKLVLKDGKIIKMNILICS